MSQIKSFEELAIVEATPEQGLFTCARDGTE